jgi:hypothetical protein
MTILYGLCWAGLAINQRRFQQLNARTNGNPNKVKMGGLKMATCSLTLRLQNTMSTGRATIYRCSQYIFIHMAQ